jgi:hypothetical protein
VFDSSRFWLKPSKLVAQAQTKIKNRLGWFLFLFLLPEAALLLFRKSKRARVVFLVFSCVNLRSCFCAGAAGVSQLHKQKRKGCYSYFLFCFYSYFCLLREGAVLLLRKRNRAKGILIFVYSYFLFFVFLVLSLALSYFCSFAKARESKDYS